MRAGLLSEPSVIEYLNRKCVSTWVVQDELIRLGPRASRLARMLSREHEYPFDFFFLTKDGGLLQRLTSFQDLPGAHKDVAHPRREPVPHIQIFMDAARRHFGD